MVKVNLHVEMAFKPPKQFKLMMDQIVLEWLLFKRQNILFMIVNKSKQKSEDVIVAQFVSTIGPEELAIYFIT